jgi:hypothetical protein
MGCALVVQHLPKYYGLSMFSKCLCIEMWDYSSQKEGLALKYGYITFGNIPKRI